MNSPDIEERTLIQKAQAGDAQAFGDLVLSYQRFVYNLALRALGSPEEAQDAAQEAFLRAWLSLAGFRGESRFSTWLYRITINVCFNRRPHLRRDLASLSIDDHEDLPGDDGNPSQSIETREQQSFLHAQVEKLPETYRLLITMRYQQELSYEDMADILNIPLGTVKTGLFRAKSQLKSALIAQARPQPAAAASGSNSVVFCMEAPEWTR